MELTEKEMLKVEGGVAWGVVASLVSGVVFIVGLLSGYTNPTKCNN